MFPTSSPTAVSTYTMVGGTSVEPATERTDDGTLDPQATSEPTGRTGSDSVCAPTEHTHGAGASTASAAPARSPSERAGSPSRPRSRERDRWRDREQERSALDRSDAREPCLRRERSVALTRRDRSDRSLPSSYLRCLSKQRKQLVGGAAAVPEACPQNQDTPMPVPNQADPVG